MALCAGNSPLTGEFPSQRPMTRGFDVFCHLCLNKRLSKQAWGWGFETPSRPLSRHCNGLEITYGVWDCKLGPGHSNITKERASNFTTDSTWALSHLISSTHQLFVQRIFQAANNNWATNALFYWPSVLEIYPWPSVSLHKGLVIRIACPWHDVIM